jgi:hypothetical protein
MKTKTIHHLNRDCTHQVIEKLTMFFGYVIKRSLTTQLF